MNQVIPDILQIDHAPRAVGLGQIARNLFSKMSFQLGTNVSAGQGEEKEEFRKGLLRL
jgi:hypothetical protein